METRRYLTVAGVVAVVVVGLAAMSLLAIWFVQRGEILPGVSVEGIEVGGLAPADAETALADTIAARQSDPVIFTLGEREFELQPSTISHTVDIDGTIDEAMAIGRDGGFVADLVDRVRSFWVEREVELETHADEEALDDWVQQLASELDQGPTIGAVSVDPDTLEVDVDLPEDGVTVRQDELRAAVLDGLATAGPDRLPLPADIDPSPITDDAVEGVARQAERAVAAPLTLASPVTDATVTLAPSELAQLISLREVDEGSDGSTVELAVTTEQAEAVLGDRAEDFRVDPVSARFEVPRTPPVTLDDKADVTWRPRPADVDIVPSTQGWQFSADLAATQLTELLQDARRQAELRLERVDADLTTEQAEELGITELIGTFTTYHKCCQNRVHNIQKLADMVDHTLVLPGEQFSINQISGNRTCAKGFVEDGMILNGEVVPVCGGGVSQFGTTTVNAVFFSGLDPDTYKPHSFYISRYPMGREATLNYPSPDIDVRFTNDTGHGILVKTSYTTTSITV
ncbi:MAG: VanW family protein, partial [Nitriliruptorales bacterium]|nr:VanW family protein [Nitriliruptorales bacterium]